MMETEVFLTATDTTVGFVSQNAAKLDAIKGRPAHKRYIVALASFQSLKTRTRIPPLHRKRVRRARRSTFILPCGTSYRVIDDRHHRMLMERLGWAYTTSANKSGEAYDETFAKAAADVIVAPLRPKAAPSSIYKLGKTRYKRIR